MRDFIKLFLDSNKIRIIINILKERSATALLFVLIAELRIENPSLALPAWKLQQLSSI